MNKRLYILLFSIITFGFNSCQEDNDSGMKYDEWKEANEVFFQQMIDSLDADGKNYYDALPGILNGRFPVLYHIVDSGIPAPENPVLPDDSVRVSYACYFYDSDRAVETKTNESFALPTLIEGWQTFLPRMNQNAVWDVVIPWQLAYGEKGIGFIHPYSTLRFTVRLEGYGIPQ